MVRARAGMTMFAAAVALLAFLPASSEPAQVVAQITVPPDDLSWLEENTVPPPPGDSRDTGTDQPDALAGNQTHALYFVPRDRPDEALDADGTLAGSLGSIKAWFSREMARSPRIDTLVGGGYDITFVRGAASAAEYDSLDDIARELKQKGFSASNKRYLIYASVSRGRICGEGFYPLLPGGDVGRYAAVYLDSATSCGARSFGRGTAASAGTADTIAVHEWLHNEAIAPITAPRHCAGSPHHICTGPLFLVAGADPEERDVMFPYVVTSLGYKFLDIGRDDYVDHPWPQHQDLRDSSWLEHDPF